SAFSRSLLGCAADYAAQALCCCEVPSRLHPAARRYLRRPAICVAGNGMDHSPPSICALVFCERIPILSSESKCDEWEMQQVENMFLGRRVVPAAASRRQISAIRRTPLVFWKLWS